jgi:hypothetical protein
MPGRDAYLDGLLARAPQHDFDGVPDCYSVTAGFLQQKAPSHQSPTPLSLTRTVMQRVPRRRLVPPLLVWSGMLPQRAARAPRVCAPCRSRRPSQQGEGAAHGKDAAKR